jgi:peptidoglycan/LPS O-acetylase OafA/YrhL
MVPGFFLISGYCIAASVEREKSGFYVRRVNRLAPVYYSCFALSIVTSFICPDLLRPTVKSVLAGSLCLVAFFPYITNTFAPAWSLTCEVIYYALAPLLARTQTKAILAAGAATAFLFAIHTWPLMDMGFKAKAFAEAPLTMAFFWFAGFVYWRHVGDARYALPMLLSAVLWPSGSGLIILTACLIYAAPQLGLSANLAGFLTWLGDLSYPLYLSHESTCLLVKWFCRSRDIPGGAYVLISVLGAIAIYRLVDCPYRSFIRSRTKAANRPSPLAVEVNVPSGGGQPALS